MRSLWDRLLTAGGQLEKDVADRVGHDLRDTPNNCWYIGTDGSVLLIAKSLIRTTTYICEGKIDDPIYAIGDPIEPTVKAQFGYAVFVSRAINNIRFVPQYKFKARLRELELYTKAVKQGNKLTGLSVDI